MKRASHKGSQHSRRTESDNAGDPPGFLSFEVIGEPWSRFRLSDGSLLKLRWLLLKMRAIKVDPSEGHRAASFSSQLLTVIETPRKFRGPPGAPLAPDQIASHIEEEVKVTPLSSSPSVYRFDEGRTMVVNVAPTKVFRTDAVGPDGERIYQVETLAQVGILGGVSVPTPSVGALQGKPVELPA